MLTLQLCGLALGFVQTVPPPAWQDLTRASYRCPLEFVRSDAPLGLAGVHRALGVRDRAWRVVPAEQAGQARAGDGVLLPDDPWRVIWQPGLRRELDRARTAGAALLVEVRNVDALGAVATTYAGLGLVPRGAFLREGVGRPDRLPPGTFLVERVGGLVPLPRVARLGERTVIPYRAERGPGELASPQATRSTLNVQPHLTWTFARLPFDSRRALTGAQQALGGAMLVVWTVGRALNATLPSLLFVASSALAWVVLGVILITATLLLRAVVRR